MNQTLAGLAPWAGVLTNAAARAKNKTKTTTREEPMPEATLNRVTLLGRLTRDPEIRSLDSGDQVATFSVATTDTWKNRSGEPQERSQFHPVVIWNQALIEATVPHLKKGSRVVLEGSLEHRTYEAEQTTRYVTEVVLRQFNGSIAMLDRAPPRQEEQRTSSRSPDERMSPRQAAPPRTRQPSRQP
jgi:single-strand DNA-binding protein